MFQEQQEFLLDRIEMQQYDDSSLDSIYNKFFQNNSHVKNLYSTFD